MGQEKGGQRAIFYFGKGITRSVVCVAPVLEMSSFLVKKIERLVSDLLPPDVLDHCLRVRKNALKIAKDERIGEEATEIVELAALLHDLAYSTSEIAVDHATKSAKMTRDILIDFEAPSMRVERVCHCIECHSLFSGMKPKSAEARILFDANALELLGPVGIIRLCLSTRGAEDTAAASVAHKLRAYGLRHYEAMHTSRAKKIAKAGWAFEDVFFRKLKRQLEA